MKQKTIQQDVELNGKGLFTGRQVRVCLKPAEVNTGIVFIREDLPQKPVIQATVDNIIQDGSGIPRCTAIGKEGAIISMVEHLMSALCGLEVDNLMVEINGDELPGLDGSGIEYFKAIQKAGLKEQEAERQYIEIREPIGVHNGVASILVVPDSDYRISYTLDYDHPYLNTQFFSSRIDTEHFEKEIAPCRTFCLEEEADKLQSMGLGKGADYTNTLVVGTHGIIKNQVRFPDEFARHKVLDFIGDLYMLGRPLRGHVFAVKSGHKLNFELLKSIRKYDESVKRSFVPDFRVYDKTALDIHDIMKILPHRHPFLMVDRVVDLQRGVKATAIKNVTINEDYFNGHFPDKPVMPGVLMVEAMAQVGGIVVLTSEQHRGKLGLFMGTDKVKFRRMVNPGDQLVMDVEVVRDRSRTALLHGTAKVGDEIVAEADIFISFVDESFLIV